MTKKELAAELAERMKKVDGFGLSTAFYTVENLVAIVSDALVRGDAITLRGFATIEPVQRKPRKARHINDGVVINMPARRDVKIRLYGEMKKRMNEPQPNENKKYNPKF